MTEIPEHLLQRSRERRAALGLGGDAPASGSGGSEATPAAATPAPATPAATPAAAAPAVPAEPKPEPPKPVPAYVQAAQQRRRIPMWAMPVLAALPLWGYVYVRTLEPAPVENDPITLGGELYSTSCAGCHGATGAGQGSTPGFDTIAETWPDYRDHLMWVRVGAQGWPGSTYGATNKTDTGVMPAFALTDQELAQVVLYERQEFGGIDVEAEEPELLAIANGEMTFAEVGLGELSEEAGISEDELGG